MKSELKGPLSHPRTSLFARRVGDSLNRLSPLVPPDLPCSDLLERIRQAGASSAVVVNDRRQPLGIVTERDIARRIAFKVGPGTPVNRVMTSPVYTIEAGDYLYQAIGRMLKLGVRHLPVLDGRGHVKGMLEFDASLVGAAGRTLEHIRQLTVEDGIEAIGRIRDAQASLAEDLLEEELPVVEIQRLITHVNHEIYGRVACRQLQLMAEAGWGAPPARYCLLVMGSGGRGENFFRPDQDHGLILEDYPDADHDRIDGYFQSFSDGLIRDLETAGFPRDSNYVMSLNPMWRKTLGQWKAQTCLWAGRGSATAMRLADIFFDFHPVVGDVRLAQQLRSHIRALAMQNPKLLQSMLLAHEEHGVGLGLFGGFITMGPDSEFRGRINVKNTGLLPLISALRLLALKHGVTATGTVERIEALGTKGVMDPDECRELRTSSDCLAGLILRHQLEALKRGETPNYYIHPDSLDRASAAGLKQALTAVRRLRDRVRADLTGDVL